MRQRYVLIIVDMQPYFLASQGERVLTACQNLIIEAQKEHNYIFFVEYKACGETDKRLTRLTKNYTRSAVVYKNDDDGSSEIISELKYRKLHRRTPQLKICGVNTDACVLSTVYGLIEFLPQSKIEVIAEACDSDVDHNYGLAEIRKLTYG